jgi:membrane associated rhomboid family serine protease
VTYALIALNVAVFLLELNGGNDFIMRWSFIPARFAADPMGAWPTVFTAMFMHAGWAHIGGNMLYLWIFGDNVEDRFGKLPFLIFYLLCGIGATFAQFAISQTSDVPNLGASGAIAGVLAAYLVLFPRAQVRVMIGFGRVTPMPAIVVIGLWIVLQLVSSVGSITNRADLGGVAYVAHVGGFFTGLALTFVFRGRSSYSGA